MIKEILIVTISLGNDGAERVLTELAREWDKQGYKVTVVQTHANRYGCSYNIPENIQRINIEAGSHNKIIRFIQEIYLLIKVLKKHPEAVCVSFLSASSFILAISSWFTKNKIIFSERNDPRKCPVGWHQRLLRNFSFYFANKIVFQTRDAMKYFSKAIQDKAEIIINPINGNLPQMYNGVREKHIVTACRLHPQKNLKMMIDAFKEVIDDYPDYKLVIYGQGVLEDELKAYVEKIGLEGKVLFPGFKKDILDRVNRASIFALSSDYEGISNAMLEAMAMGVPVVVTDCPVGGAKMVIQDKINGMLVPVKDAGKMASAMKEILSDSDFANKLSDNAYKIRDMYPLSKIARQWIGIMEKICN